MDGAQNFEQYRQRLLLTQARWASGIAGLITPLGGLAHSQSAEDTQNLLPIRLALGVLFGLIFLSTYAKKHSPRTGIWQTLAVAIIGSAGATLLTLGSGEWGLRQQGAINVVVLGCGLLFPWRLKEIIPACGFLLFLFVLPPLLSTRPHDFQLRVYLLLVTEVIAVIAAHRSVTLREREFEARRSLEDRTTELVETSHQLAASVDQLRKLDQQKNEFFANISHELRTPLTLLVSPLDRLRRMPAGTYSPEVSWQLDTMHRNVRVLVRHIEGLLNLIRMDEGQIQLNRKAMRLRPLIDSLVSRFEPHANEQGIRLEVTGADATVLGDSERLDTLFSNLLSNALKFTGRGGRIGFALTRHGDNVEVAVSDTGKGIPPAEQQQIFERFVQGKNAGGRGLGIGLALVKEILSLHGGAIAVSSVVGEGSTFRVTLPVAPAEPDAAVVTASRAASGEMAALSTTAPPMESGPSAAERVLVVEDQEDLRNFLTVCLRERFSVYRAATGEQGLAMAEQISPDVIVCDLRLPDRTGLELTRTLRAHRTTADIPVILITAFETPELRVEGLRQGAVDFLGKPFSPAELIARIDVQVRLRKLAADSARSQKLAMLQTLLEGLAHEVRNPLNVIANTAPLLRKELGKSGVSLVALVEESSARIGLLVDDLTALSRSDSESRWTDWSPSSSVEATLRLLEARCSTITVTKALAFAGKVRGRGAQLDQIVMNLLDNALRAMPQGGALEVRADTRDRELALSVRDSGVGIPAGMVPRIFDPFFTTRATGEGTGLGLHISRRIAEAHGGRIEVTSEPGKGSCFTLLLPLQEGDRAG